MRESCVLLAPRKEIARIAEIECKKRNWSCKVVYCINNQVAVEFAKKYKENGVRVFISRGGMAKAVERDAEVEVVSIEITFQDVMEAVDQAKELGRKIGISINSALKFDLEQIRSMFGVDVETVQARPGELLMDTMQRAADEGFDVIIGGAAPTYFASQTGMQTVPLPSGKNSIAESIEKALLKAERGYNLELFEGLREGIVVLDQQGEVLYANKNAYRILSVDPEEPNFSMINTNISSDTKSLVLGSEFTYRKKRYLFAESSFYIDNLAAGKVIQFCDCETVSQLHDRLRNRKAKGENGARYVFSDIITQNERMKHMLEQAKVYARTNSTILITGKTGTGKELLAQSIHNASYRSDQPFIAINCSAIPESILESELFGYEAGAFTGALRSGKKGLFEAAGKGTIFLDEIGELSSQMQAKLLRVLQEKEIMRIGSSEVIPVHARVIAATLVDLEEMMEKGRFRRDLYYRLNILNLQIPALRERKDDIPLLVRSLVYKISSRLKMEVPDFTEHEFRLFQQYEWEGNVRELENVLERIVILSNGRNTGEVVRDMLYHNQQKCQKEICPQTLESVEKQMILASLARNQGDREKAAEELGISATTLWRRIKEWEKSK